ncbi:MAG: hypothetical protein ABIH42_04420 [Planctomycetota bacterium]
MRTIFSISRLKSLSKTSFFITAFLCMTLISHPIYGENKNQEEKKDTAACILDSECVIHGLVNEFTSGANFRITFLIKEIFKGSYPEKNVEVNISPELADGLDAFSLFKKSGHEYIVCFNKAKEGDIHEYSGPKVSSEEIVANEINLLRVRAIIRKSEIIPVDTHESDLLPWIPFVVGIAFLLILVTAVVFHIKNKN